MPLEMSDIKRYLIEKETKSLANSIKNAAGDLWRVRLFVYF
jgi:hypothetical protein